MFSSWADSAKQQKMTILPLFTHPHVVPKPYGIVYSMEHKRTFSAERGSCSCPNVLTDFVPFTVANKFRFHQT